LILQDVKFHAPEQKSGEKFRVICSFNLERSTIRKIPHKNPYFRNKTVSLQHSRQHGTARQDKPKEGLLQPSKEENEQTQGKTLCVVGTRRHRDNLSDSNRQNAKRCGRNGCGETTDRETHQ
jgi:hypothetical protein